MNAQRLGVIMWLGFSFFVHSGVVGDDSPKRTLKSESFDQDPGWEGFNNRIVPQMIPTVSQDFGYSSTNFAGQQKGEIGGKVTRSSKPCYYADKIATKTLNETLTASGTFAITSSTSSAGINFGWFNADQPVGTGRPTNSLGLCFDAEPTGARLAVFLLTSTNKTCGTFVTPFVPGPISGRPTPIKHDGTRYAWTLKYDPEANNKQGRIAFAIKSNSAKPEPFEGQTISVDLPVGLKAEGANFDRFGLINIMKPGNSMTIHFDDLEYDGKRETFDSDPNWTGSNNQATFEDLPVGAHNFGHSPTTNFAGGNVGEVGGDLWRSGKYGYYADKIGKLSMNDRLEASGKVVLKAGAPDSDIYIGWFNSSAREKPPADSGNFLGIHVGGPTRIGHYFNPALATAKGSRGKVDAGPVLVPGKTFAWSLTYLPSANDDKGELQVTLGSESVSLRLPENLKSEGTSFDRFGLFTSTAGGQLVRIYLDDLKYTVGRPIN